MTGISGTANADLAGLSKVEVRLQRTAGGPDEDWTGSSWTALNDHYSTATLSGVGGNVSWNYADLAGAFADNQEHKIYLRVTDLAGNVRAAPGAGDWTFRYDTLAPTLSIGFLGKPPSPPAYSNNAESTRLSTYTWGSVADPGANASGVTQVWLAISSGVTENIWWNDSTRLFDTTQAVVFSDHAGVRLRRQLGLSTRRVGGGAFADGGTYKIFARARDAAGNWVNNVTNPATSGVGQTQQFKYDISRTTNTVTTPANGATVKVLPAFSGATTDPGSASRESRSFIWPWSTPPVQAALSVGITGARVFTRCLLPAPHRGRLDAGGHDQRAERGFRCLVDRRAGGQDRQFQHLPSRGHSRRLGLKPDAKPRGGRAGSTFTFDEAVPGTAVTLPAASVAQNSLTQITGTASDNMALDSVWVRFYNQGADQYWDNNLQSFTIPPASVETAWYVSSATLSNWTVWHATFTFTNETTYRVEAKARDNAGNFDTVTSTQTFLYDTVAAQSFVGLPVNSSVINSLATITGTSTDVGTGSGVNTVSMAIRRNSDNLWWGGASFNQAAPSLSWRPAFRHGRARAAPIAPPAI